MNEAELRLKARVEAESMACIGCNDCMLACPIQQSKAVTIAELNAAIFLPTIEHRHVADFVLACTQCKQCVPACPSDLNRAEMVLFNKLKVENSVADFQLSLQARTTTFPSGMSLYALAEKLTHLELFAGANPQAMRRLLLKSTLRLLVPGEDLCQEGEFHERLCVVLDGSLEQTSRGPRGERIHILVIGPGAFFGEMGVLADAAEPFGVTARERAIVLEVPKVAVLSLMDLCPDFGEALQSLYARRALFSYAKQPRGLGALPEAALEELLTGAELVLVPAGSVLFNVGDAPRDFYLVRNGFLRARRDAATGPLVLTYFREGNVFGVLGLLHRDTVHRYTVEAVSRAEVIRIPGALLGQVLARHPAAYGPLLSGFEAEQLARTLDVGSLPPPPMSVDGSRLSVLPSSSGRLGEQTRSPMAEGVLMEAGLASGREVLVIDQTRCTSCGNCIDACERRHGYSRLQLRGIQVDTYMFPTACRHCSDPTCLMCSVNGIVRLPSGEIQIVKDNCIGCGACAERCPYGNISMHPVVPEKAGFFPNLLDFLAGKRARKEAHDALDPKVQRIAVKCDLCAGHHDYACVTACPVAAAFRVDPGRIVVDPNRGL
ncbi:MAG: cyclic nucleotide-binding domain-containing protein [Polyangiaceae bacterium]